MSQSESRIVWVLFLVAAVMLVWNVGTFPLQMQWEPNYGQVVREMTVGEGDSITPKSMVGADEGAKRGEFWSKPIMIFWLAYPLSKLFGTNEWTLRLPVAFVGIYGFLMTFLLLRRLYGQRMALISSLVLLTTPTYFLISRAFMVDAPFLIFMWVALLYLFVGEKEGKAKYYYYFYILLGLSALAKGLLPILLTGGVLFFYCLLTTDWALLKRMHIGKGLLIFSVIAVPWYAYMTFRFGDAYLIKFFYDHHVERSLGKLDKPDDTFQMFVLYFTIGFLPWVTFLPQALVKAIPWNRKNADRSFEIVWVIGFVLCFTFFSAIKTKFPHYIFPVIPFAAVLVGYYLNHLLEEDKQKAINRISIWIALLILIVAAPDLLDKKNYRIIFYFITTERLQDWHPNVANPEIFFSIIYWLWGAVMVAALVMRRFTKHMMAALVILMMAYAFYINGRMIPTLTQMFSADQLVAKYLELRKSPEEPIGEFTQTWKSRSIKYYMPFDELWKKYDYRRYRIYDNVGSVRRFYEKYKGKRVFIIIEEKQKHFKKLSALWQEVSDGEKLYQLSDDRVEGEAYRPEFWLVSNCNEKGVCGHVSQEERQAKLKKYIREPNEECWVPEHVLEPPAIIEKNIELYGYNLDPSPKIDAGATLDITLYFRAKKAIQRDMEVFIHAERDTLFRLRGDHHPADNLYPTTKWKVGDCIKDAFSIDVPANIDTGKIDIFVGMFKGNTRYKIDPHPIKDNDNRLMIGTVEVVEP